MQIAHNYPVLSVITPSFNQGAFIEDTIKSVLQQAGDFYLDYIIVDGGSTDQTIEIIRRYDGIVRNDAWPVQCRGIQLRWMSEKDGGQSDALIKGFSLARGEILAWLNSDDRYVPGALQTACGFLADHRETVLVYGKALLCSSTGKVMGEHPTEPFSYDRLAETVLLPQPAAFFRTDAYHAAGGLNRDLHYAMDYDLWIRLSKRGTVGYIPEHLAIFTLHSESKSVSDRHALGRSRECLDTVLHYYRAAPANRVFAYCFFLVKSWLPPAVAQKSVLVTLASLAVFPIVYLLRNRGIRLRDLRLLTMKNVKKLMMPSTWT